MILRAYGNSKMSTLANFYGEKAEVTFEGVTYSSLSLLLSIKKISRRMASFKKSCFPREEGYDGKKPPALHLCKT